MRFFKCLPGGFSVLRALALAGLWFTAGCSTPNGDAPLEIDPPPELLEWVGSQIFKNECGERKACLVHWNEGEAFPSLGIGHFIWYPPKVSGRFVESFPAMIRYLDGQGVARPDLLRLGVPFDAPWLTRSEFLAQSDSPEVEALREFLFDTKGAQAGFIVNRASEALERVIGAAPDSDKEMLRVRIQSLAGSPGGVYALIDYVNFKGEGLSASEQYRGEGWGLLQVLQAMDGQAGKPPLAQFRDAAAAVLTRRANNAENDIEKDRWLAGWLNRLDTYREPDQR